MMSHKLYQPINNLRCNSEKGKLHSTVVYSNYVVEIALASLATRTVASSASLVFM